MILLDALSPSRQSERSPSSYEAQGWRQVVKRTRAKNASLTLRMNSTLFHSLTPSEKKSGTESHGDVVFAQALSLRGAPLVHSHCRHSVFSGPFMVPTPVDCLGANFCFLPRGFPAGCHNHTSTPAGRSGCIFREIFLYNLNLMKPLNFSRVVSQHMMYHAELNQMVRRESGR